jgi:predicted DNA-binding transcriptional regulator AlpA
VVVALLVVVMTPIVYSYVSTMLSPSSLPLGVRTVEWIRSNGGAWLVNDIERWYYSWNAPSKGGPPLHKLPKVGLRTHTPPAVKAAAYRPANIRPVIHPAVSGEGVWARTGPEINGVPPVLVTEFRPEAAYPRNLAYVAWINHKVTQLALYPGRYEPPSNRPRGPMKIPPRERYRLLASFNSGFTYGDGHGGFAVNGHTYTPFTDGTGTLIGSRYGTVNIQTWQGPSSPTGKWIAFARQNLPLIVDHGRPNPNLSGGPEWGATLGNAVRVWRSGVGIDRHGNLIYLAADYMTVSSLANALIHAGAVRALEFDINPEWPSFITYFRYGGRNPQKIVPNVQQPATRYLNPDDRDFFAVYRRLPHRPVTVPFK